MSSTKPSTKKPKKTPSTSTNTNSNTTSTISNNSIDAQQKTHKLSLKGSSKLVSEFFEFSIHTILFQRGVYPAEDFTPVKKYGLNMLVSSDDQVKAYIKRIMSQLSKWMTGGQISKLVIVITSKESGEVLERWQFDVQLLGRAAEMRKNKEKEKDTCTDGSKQEDDGGGDENSVEAASLKDAYGKQQQQQQQQQESQGEKSEKEIQDEIQSLFRQITASVTFLPMLDGRCTFNVLVYADGDAEVPVEWGDSDAKEIKGGEKVALRSWGTSSHRVDTLVSYRLAD